jgi:uncharacterized protein YndB with AHSA1/START domain
VNLVTVAIEVAAPPHEAFRIFTDEIDRWWLRGPKHRFKPPWNGTMFLEARVGGRFMEQYADGTAFVIGRVNECVPPRLLRFDWRLPSFSQSEKTEVLIRFEPTVDGTRIAVEHRGWHALREDHPARHRLTGTDLEYAKARLWGENLGALRRHVVTMEGESRCHRT